MVQDLISTPTRPERPVRPQTRRRKRSPLRRAAGWFALIVVFCCIVAAGVFTYLYVSSKTARVAVNVLASRNYTPARAFPHQDQVNLLLMGRDLDRDRYGNIVHTRGRTDAMMLAHIDFKNRAASILSIPRDTLVRIPGYRGKRRISYANAYGGPDLAMDTVEKFVGIRPDYYVLVNFSGFERAIDAVGGLDINVDKQLDYDDNWGNLHIHLKPGMQKLDGYQAMGFVRYRHANGGGGDSDLVRISRQQEFLRAARAKLTSPGVAFKVPKVLDMIQSDMQGNLSPAQIMCLACFMRSLPEGQGLRMETVPAQLGGGVFVRADMDATNKLVSEMFFDKQQ